MAFGHGELILISSQIWYFQMLSSHLQDTPELLKCKHYRFPLVHNKWCKNGFVTIWAKLYVLHLAWIKIIVRWFHMFINNFYRWLYKHHYWNVCFQWHSSFREGNLLWCILDSKIREYIHVVYEKIEIWKATDDGRAKDTKCVVKITNKTLCVRWAKNMF